MRRVLLTGLGWTLGWAALAQADDGLKSPAADPGNNAGLPARAAPLGTPRVAPLGRPRPLPPPGLTTPGDPALTPAAYAAVVPDAPFIARGQLPDTKPMPTGPGTNPS